LVLDAVSGGRAKDSFHREVRRGIESRFDPKAETGLLEQFRIRTVHRQPGLGKMNVWITCSVGDRRPRNGDTDWSLLVYS
jgi:hypothetical protein